MNKKDYEWLYQYPSTTVKWKIVPTGANATPYIGEANKLLYQTKNLMTFNQLLQSRSVRIIFGDKGVAAKIIASSAFGQDFIEIHVSSVEAPSIPFCSITLYNIPEEVQPMKWYSDGIHAGEVEGVDYIKTYYSFSSDNCPDCILDLTVCDDNELLTTYGWTAPQICKPFTYQSENDDGEPIIRYQGQPVPHYEGYPLADPPIPPDPANHCVYGTCQAEIIKFDGDAGGTYFLWKVYTEWSSLGPSFATFTQSGLGYLLIRAFSMLQGIELCTSDSSIIKVDCCLKIPAKRPVIIFWEKCDLEELCEAPATTPISDIDWFWVMGGWNIMMLWLRAPTSQQFSCGPYVWSLTGMGELVTNEIETGIVEYRVPTAEFEARDCHDEITIGVVDRCGTTDSILFTSCCTDAAALELTYTTLQMACSGSQTFGASGGCGPYTWSATTGSITQAGVYTAPTTNANCAYNPTISVSDCCGQSDDITLAVNCYAPAANALSLAHTTMWYCCEFSNCNACGYCHRASATFYHWMWDCNAIQTSYCTQGPTSPPTPGADCGGCGSYTFVSCPADIREGSASLPNTCCGANNCYASGCSTCNCGVGCVCGVVNDCRTAAMKTEGCCPLNPITGLPYS